MTPPIITLPEKHESGERYAVVTGEMQGATVTVSYRCDQCRSLACDHIRAVKTLLHPHHVLHQG